MVMNIFVTVTGDGFVDICISSSNCTLKQVLFIVHELYFHTAVKKSKVTSKFLATFKNVYFSV